MLRQLGADADEPMEDLSSVAKEIEELSKQSQETMQASLKEVEQSIAQQELRV